MATYNSNAVALRYPMPAEGTGGGADHTQYCEITIPAGATTADIFNLFDIPRRARVMSFKYSCDALGAGTINVGDTGSSDIAGNAIAANAARYIAGGAITTAAVVTSAVVGGVYFYTGNGVGSNKGRVRVQATLATGPTTTAGIFRCNMTYTVEEPQLA